MGGRDLLIATDKGLYSPQGDFHIDPWGPVDCALITHAHSDHARPGCGRYVAVRDGLPVLRARLGPDAPIDPVEYGETLRINGLSVSFHPAGHILGSAQIRIEHQGDVWVFSGDYKVAPDATCAPFEPLRCSTFITESTFGLPIFRWQPQESIFAEVNDWWRSNAADGRASLVYVYALGKAQRLLSGLDPSIGPVAAHGAVQRMTEAYRESGVVLPETRPVAETSRRHDWSTALILAPPSARGTPWLKRFGDFASGYASGWMQVRGMRRRRTIDRGFVLSDHADWPGLIDSIRSTGAERVLVTHGSIGPMVRWLRENGWEAAGLATLFEGEPEEAGDDTEEATATIAESPSAEQSTPESPEEPA
jgi:putative mRNA 3-end processing factor